MKPIRIGYFVRYRLYGINNTITLYNSSQYHNWFVVMKTEFKDQFKVVEVLNFDI